MKLLKENECFKIITLDHFVEIKDDHLELKLLKVLRWGWKYYFNWIWWKN
jgi:hypothetical protein